MKHNFKRTLSLLMALVMALSCMSLSAFADGDPVAKIGETLYTSLAEAIAAAQDGDTITVSAGQFDIAATTVIPAGVTIQGAGKDSTILTITTENGDGIKITNPRVNIKNLTIKGTNIKSIDYSSLINVEADGVVIDGVTMTGGGMSTWSSSILVETLKTGTTFTVSNSTISGSFRGVLRESCDANIVIDNCDIDAVYPFNINGGNKTSTVTVNGGALHGWTSYDGVKSVTFNNVTFSKANTGYDNVAAYVDTTFNNCTFDAEFKTYAQEPNFTWTFTNCTEDGTLVTKNNFKLRFPEDRDVWEKCELIVNGETVAAGLPVASIGTGANAMCYDTLAAAVEAAGENDTITLLSNVSGYASFPAGKTLTLDLNGKTITEEKNCGIYVSGNLTITDSSEGKTGEVKAQEAAVLVGYNSGNAALTINGGTFTAIDNFVVGTNGSTGMGGNTITINGGTFNGGITSAGYVACGIYAPNNDTWNINGGTFNITGGAGIVARAGTATVAVGEDVVFNCTGTATGKVGDAAQVVPCAPIVFDSKSGYPGLTSNSAITVNGGVFNCDASVAAVQHIHNDADPDTRIAITGGTFSSDPTAYVASGFKAYAHADGTYTVAAANAAVAQIGEGEGAVEYLTLEDAFAAAVDGNTITVLADCSGNGIQVPQGKFTTGLTVDFGGYTYKMDGTLVGSTGTETQAFQLLKNNTITFKNGTITSAKAKILIQNYSDLTLDGMTLTLDNLDYAYAYTLSNNNGNIVIDDTTINANPAGRFAFDVCRYSSYPSVKVTVTGNSVINGNIEASASNNSALNGMNLVFEGGKLNGKIIVDASAKTALASASANSKLLISGGKFAFDPRTEGVTIDDRKTVTSNTDEDDKETYPYTIGTAVTLDTTVESLPNVSSATVGETTTKAKNDAPDVATTAYEVTTTGAVKLNVVPEVDDKLAATAPTTDKEVVTVAELAGINAGTNGDIEAVAAAKVVESTNAALAAAASEEVAVTGGASVTNTWDIVTKPEPKPETESAAAAYVEDLFASNAESYKDIPTASTVSAKSEMTQAVTNAAKVFNTNVTNTTVITISGVPYTGTAVVRADDDRYYEHELTGLTPNKMYEATGFHGDSEDGLVKTERAIKADGEGKASLITKGLSIVTVKESNKTYVAHVTVGTTTYYFESFTGNTDTDKNAFDCVTNPTSEVYGQTVVIDVAGEINYTLADGETLTVDTNGKQGTNTFVVTAAGPSNYYIDATTSGNVKTFVSRPLVTLTNTGDAVTMIYEAPSGTTFTKTGTAYDYEISFIKSGFTGEDGKAQYVLVPIRIGNDVAGHFKGVDIQLNNDMSGKYSIVGFNPATGVEVVNDLLDYVDLEPTNSDTDFAYGQMLGDLVVKVTPGKTLSGETDTLKVDVKIAYDEQLMVDPVTTTLDYTVPIGHKVTVNAIMDDNLETAEKILKSLTIGNNGWYVRQTNSSVSAETIDNADENTFANVAENYYASGTDAIPITWAFASGMDTKYQFKSIGSTGNNETVTAPDGNTPASFTAPTSDAVVNVHFEARTFTITFDGNLPTTAKGYPGDAQGSVNFNSGDGARTQTVKYNVKTNLNKKSALDTAYTELANDTTLNTATLEGWTFEGWTQGTGVNYTYDGTVYTDDSDVSDDFTLYSGNAAVSASDTTVYAKWSAQPYKIYAAFVADWADSTNPFTTTGQDYTYAELAYVGADVEDNADKKVTSASAISGYETGDNAKYSYTVELKTKTANGTKGENKIEYTESEAQKSPASIITTGDNLGSVTVSSKALAQAGIQPGSSVYVYVYGQINADVKAYPLSNNVVLVTATNAAGKQLSWYNEKMLYDARYGTENKTQVMLIDYSMGGYANKTLADVANTIKGSDNFSANDYVMVHELGSLANIGTADIAANNYNVNGIGSVKPDIVDITLVYNAYKGTYSYAADPAKGGRLSASVSQYLLSDVTFTKNYDDSSTDPKAGTLDTLSGAKTQLIDMLDVKAEYTKAYSGT